jgi:regulator of replication initiation timing
MTDLTRFEYLINQCLKFLWTREQQEEIQRLANEVVQENEQLRAENERMKTAFDARMKEYWDAIDEKTMEHRRSTWDWIKRHYGKAIDWARHELPEPYRTTFFNCLANGTSDWTKSDYYKIDAVQEKMLFEQMRRAEEAEQDAERLANFIRYAMRVGALRGERLAPMALKVLDEHHQVEPDDNDARKEATP